MTTFTTFNTVMEALLADAISLHDETEIVATETFELEKAMSRLLEGALSKAKHAATVTSLEAIKEKHVRCSEAMDSLITQVRDALKVTTNKEVAQKSAKIQAMMNAADESLVSDLSVRERLINATSEMATHPSTKRFFSAVVLIKLASSLDAHNSAYRDVLDVTETIQRPDALNQLRMSYKRISKSLVSEGFGTLLPGAGVVGELLKISKETRSPELRFSSALASEQDRLNFFGDNVDRVLELIEHSAFNTGLATTQFQEANSTFIRAADEVIMLLSTHNKK